MICWETELKEGLTGMSYCHLMRYSGRRDGERKRSGLQINSMHIKRGFLIWAVRFIILRALCQQYFKAGLQRLESNISVYISNLFHFPATVGVQKFYLLLAVNLWARPLMIHDVNIQFVLRTACGFPVLCRTQQLKLLADVSCNWAAVTQLSSLLCITCSDKSWDPY